MGKVLKNYLGKKFNKLTILEDSGLNKNGKKLVTCQCDCEHKNIKISELSSVINGRTKSCGCLYKKDNRLIDILGQKFGRLIVVKFIGYIKRNATRRPIWKCKCECSAFIEVDGIYLKAGKIKSCGCLLKDMYKKGPANKLPNGEAALNTYFRQYKRNAKAKNRCFELTKDEFASLVSLDCFYCGAEPNKCYPPYSPKYYMPNGFVYVNGIDRVDTSIGYAKNNCVPCCYDCNKAKMARTIEEFHDWAINLYNTFIKVRDGKFDKENYLAKMERPICC